MWEYELPMKKTESRMAHDESAEHDGNPLELGVAHFPANIR